MPCPGQVCGPDPAQRWVRLGCRLLHPSGHRTRGSNEQSQNSRWFFRECAPWRCSPFLSSARLLRDPLLDESSVDILGGWGRWGKHARPRDNPLPWEISVYFCYPHGLLQWLRSWRIGLQCRRPGFDLEEGMATHSSIHAWKTPWTEDPGRLQSIESQKSWTRLRRLSTLAWKTREAVRTGTDDLENKLRLGNGKSVGLERKANGILSHPFHFLFLFYKMKRDGLQFSVTNHALTNPIYWYHLHCICRSCRSYRKEINSKKTPKTTASILQRYV